MESQLRVLAVFLARRAIFWICAVFFATFLAFPSSSFAVNTETVGILPAYPDPSIKFSDAWFIFNVGLGQKKNDAIRVINNKKETVVVKLYSVDATTTSDGAFALQPEDAPREDVGKWIKLSVNEVEIPASSEKVVPFSFSVPENADAGDHAGGIIMQEMDGGDRNVTGTGVKIITRVGVRVYQTVPGEVKKGFEITGTSWHIDKKVKRNFIRDLLNLNNRTIFAVGIKNTGNVKISPKARVEITNLFGSKIGEIPESEIGMIFPKGENKESTVIWDDAPIFGRYEAKVSVNFLEEGLGEDSRAMVIWVIPYRVVIIIAFLLIVITLLRLVSQYSLESSKEKMPIYAVRSGDTLGTLAAKFMVNWKKLAKVNGVKKPFDIRAGQRLFIPVNGKNLSMLARLVEKDYLKRPFREKKGKKLIKLALFLTILGVAALAGGFFYLKNKNTVRQQEINVDKKTEAPQGESREKTASGVVKKSGINVGIVAPADLDAESNVRLSKKLELAGYKVEIMESSSRDYKETTVEYNAGKKEAALAVQKELEDLGGLKLEEKSGLTKDVIVYNLLDKNSLLNIGDLKTSDARELIKVRIVEEGGTEEQIKKMQELVDMGGFNLIDGSEKGQNSETQGLKIMYIGEQQKKSAAILADYLKEKGQKVSVEERGSEGSESDPLLLVVGK